ncbi:MAG: roadblock/LC7 domain-containing protein [Candidatus Hodarchaeales archaeon]|jgi:predicted regulator of Ras-like GTPase activity (Roadblock/LC7/MglB family)
MDMSSYQDKNEALQKVLRTMMDNLPQIELAAVVSMEGLPITHYPEQLPEGVDNTRVAAMTAAMSSLGERAMMEVGRSDLLRIFVEGEDGYLISVTAGTKAVLTVSARKPIKLGLIFFDIKTASKDVGDILDNP